MLLRQIQANLPALFGLFFFLVSGKIISGLSAIETDEGMCDVVRVTEFKSTRLDYGEIEMHCNMGKVECFFKCLNNTKCRSFAVGVNESCSGTFCLLYSRSLINTNHFLEDSNTTYFFMGSSCCNSTCLNGASCRSKVCTCTCKKEYASLKCICPTNNITQNFSHNWKIVTETSSLTQIDSGAVQTWATRFDDWNIFTLQNGAWIKMVGGLTHVTVGKSGVWGVNGNDNIFFRRGVTAGAPYGTWWKRLSGALRQIDAGSSGVVYGVNKYNDIFCRADITEQLPYGSRNWILLPGKFKYVSCGDYGCWAIKPDNSIAFRTGVTFDYPQGTDWFDVDGSFVHLEAGYKSRVYAVNSENILYYRVGICVLHPTGTKWRPVESLHVKHVAVGDNSLFVIATNGTIFAST